jgi:anaerobic magnesium-protoporphyrin IX monomethyl ester cyclase
MPYPNVFSHIAMPPIGILHIATAVKLDGQWDVEVIDEMNWRHNTPRHRLALDSIADHKDLQKRRPAQAVGFYGGLTATIPRLFQLAKFYKGLGLPTVSGGAHVDALPEEALREGIDIVVRGEGEGTVGEILQAFRGEMEFGDVRGISYIDEEGNIQRTEDRKPVCDLDELPTPMLDTLVEVRRPLTIIPFERTRGCNFNCEFCVVHDRFGPSRSASPERVAAEIEQRVDEGYRKFFCVDDNFTQGRDAIIELLTLIQDVEKRKKCMLEFTVQARSSVGRDEELMRTMRAAGVNIIAIGLESPIHEELKGMSKKQTPEQIERDVRNLRKHGFMIHGMFIFGYPLEDTVAAAKLTLRERADRYIEFIRRTAIDTIQVMKPVPVPGSRLAQRLKEQGRILPLKLVGWDKYDGSFLTFLPDAGISAEELQKQATRILRRFYNPFNFLRFPMLVFTTPVEILRLGFKRTAEFAKDPAGHTQAAVRGGVERFSAMRSGFSEASKEIARQWRGTIFRTIGSAIFSNAIKLGKHAQYLKTLSTLQSAPEKEGS